MTGYSSNDYAGMPLISTMAEVVDGVGHTTIGRRVDTSPQLTDPAVDHEFGGCAE